MSVDEANDDLCGVKPPFRAIACVPAFGRLPLLKHTIERLYKKNGVYKVICTGGIEERKTCEEAGAIWVQHENKPLGRKWNRAFQKAAEYNPDVCVFVGSSDWLSDNWIDELKPWTQDFDLVGLPGCYFTHINHEYRLVHWAGYEGRRENESIGIGRLISKRVLDKIDWCPFDDKIDNSLDFSMYNKVEAGKRKTVHTKDCFSLSISTDKWPNKHSFDQHWRNLIKSERIDKPIPFLMKNFPEAFQIF